MIKSSPRMCDKEGMNMDNERDRPADRTKGDMVPTGRTLTEAEAEAARLQFATDGGER